MKLKKGHDTQLRSYAYGLHIKHFKKCKILLNHINYTRSNIQSDNSDTYENTYIYCPMYVIRLNMYLLKLIFFSVLEDNKDNLKQHAQKFTFHYQPQVINMQKGHSRDKTVQT